MVIAKNSGKVINVAAMQTAIITWLARLTVHQTMLFIG
jgi:hypothetical protein